MIARLWGWMKPRLGWLLPLLALLLAAPSLWGGFFMDDYAQLAVLAGRGRAPTAMTPSDLFVFADGNTAHIQQQIDQGILPWWTSLDMKLALWRPLSVGLSRLDYALFGEYAPLHHAHSLLWLVALVATVTALYRRTLGAAAGLAALLFTLDDAHAWPALWVANRNAVVAAVFGLLALLAHHRARSQGWRPGAWLAPPLLAMALLSGETGLALAAYFPAYELWAAPGTWRSRLARLSPFALLVVGYLALHSALGYGADSSGVYLDPRAMPGPWLQAAPGRLLALLGGLLVNSPVELWTVTAKAKLPLLMAAAAGLGLLGWLTRQSWPELNDEQCAHFKFYTTGALLALLPVLSTFPSSRLCVAASIGAFAAIAMVVTTAARRAERAVRWPASAWVGLHLIATLGWIPMHMMLAGTSRRAIAMVHAMDFGPLQPDSVMVNLFAPDPVSSFYPLTIREAEGLPTPSKQLLLSTSPHTHRYTRTAERTLELSVIDGALLDTPIEQLVRSAIDPIRTGDRMSSQDLDAEVLAAEGGRVTRVRFTFRHSLDDPRLVLMWWRDGGLRRAPALAIGESLTAPASLGLFGPVLGE